MGSDPDKRSIGKTGIFNLLFEPTRPVEPTGPAKPEDIKKIKYASSYCSRLM